MMPASPTVGDIAGLTNTLNRSDTSKQETQVTDIAEVSRTKAQKMVHAAMQVLQYEWFYPCLPFYLLNILSRFKSIVCRVIHL